MSLKKNLKKLKKISLSHQEYIKFIKNWRIKNNPQTIGSELK